MTRRSFVGTGSVLLAAGGLTACANQQGSASSESGLTSLTFCLDYVPNTNHTGIYVAQAKGYFEEEGLQIRIVQPAEDTAELMIGTGRAEIGVSYQDYIANALVGGNVGIEAIAAILQHNTSGIMSRAEDGITKPAALEDHAYATWGLPVELATIRQIVTKDGGDYAKVESHMVPYEVDDDVQGLKEKAFDAVWVYEGWAVQNAKVQGFDVNYFSFISVDEVFDYYTPVLAANVDYAKQNPDTIRAFLRAAKKGYEFAIEKPDEAAEILCDQVPELAPSIELVRASQAYLAGQYQADASSWGVIDGTRWASFYEWLNENDLVEHKLDPKSGYTTEYLS